MNLKLLLVTLLTALFAGNQSTNSSQETAQSFSVESSGLMVHGDVVFQIAEISTNQNITPPLVILAGGSNGGFWFGSFGQELLENGFSVMLLSYFGQEDQPEHLIERPIEPLANIIQLARTTRNSQRRCLALVGVSKGGELTLLLTAYDELLTNSVMPLVDAAVAAVPSHVVWQAPHISLRTRSSWSMEGEPMDFVPYPWLSGYLPDVFFNRLEVGRYVLDALRNEEAAEHAAIPVEDIRVPTLMIAGSEDLMWPSEQMSKAAMERANRLNPDTPLRLDIRELDHFVMSDEQTRSDAIDFLEEVLISAQADGKCTADFG